MSWTTNSAVATGEFGVWVRSSDGLLVHRQARRRQRRHQLPTSVALDVPAGTGYQAIVAWRPMAGSGTWVDFGTQTGAFTVTAATPALTVTAPTSTGSYAVGASLTVSWTTNSAVSSGEFGVWVRSSDGLLVHRQARRRQRRHQLLDQRRPRRARRHGLPGDRRLAADGGQRQLGRASARRRAPSP